MPASKLDLVIHPIRYRIIVEISGARMTAKDLAKAMPDIPQATLYRHINALVEGGIISVVAENPVRGTVERVYAIEDNAVNLSPEDIQDMTKEDYERAATVFFTSFLGDVARYLDSKGEGKIDPYTDGMSISKVQLHLTDEEFEVMNQQICDLMLAAMQNEPSPERKRRIFAYMFIPTEDAAKEWSETEE